MNDKTGGNRGLRGAGILAVLAAVAVLATACGGSSPSSAGSGTGGSAAFRRALAYTQCMRTHGVPDYPDPNASGLIAIPPSMNPNSSQNQAANSACQHLQPAGVPPAQAQQNLRQELRLSQCMRTHGVPDFPDPGANGQASAPATGLNKDDEPQIQAALSTCRSLLHIHPKGTAS